jgi:hypothetical protein
LSYEHRQPCTTVTDSETHHLNAGILAAPVETRRMPEYRHGLGGAKKERKQRVR